MRRRGLNIGKSSEGFKTDGLIFNFDSKDASSYDSGVPDRWTDLVTGNYLTSNATEKYNISEGGLNLTNQGEILTANSPLIVPSGDFSIGFYSKIINFYSPVGGFFRSNADSKGNYWWFFYSDNNDYWFRVNADSFMTRQASGNLPLNENHYYSISYTDTVDGDFKSGTQKMYKDGVLFHTGGVHTAKNLGFPIHVFNRNFDNNQTTGQYLKNINAHNHALTANEHLNNYNYLNGIHGS